MAKTDRDSLTLFELARLRTGSFLRASKVQAFVVAWAIARSSLGHDPSMEEYAAYWKTSNATAYREQALFREVFPQLHDPGPVLELLESLQAQPADPVRWGGLAAA